MIVGNSEDEVGGGGAATASATREEAALPNTAAEEGPAEGSREQMEPGEPRPPQSAPPGDPADPDAAGAPVRADRGAERRRSSADAEHYWEEEGPFRTRTAAEDGNTEGSRGQRSGSDANQGWEKVARYSRCIFKARTAVGKVKLENKIGRRASQLDDGDFLKVAALSVQRALRGFGWFPASDVVRYKEEKTRSKYTVRQPRFRCCRICDGEFSRVRSAFGITDRQYYAVFGLQEGRSESDLYVVSSEETSGKSKCFFFLSPDQRYLLKSCTSKEVKTLMSIVREYREYVESCKRGGGSAAGQENGSKSTSTTLLPRYLGLYSLEFVDPDVPPVVMVAMNNFFGGVYEIHHKFDLKGSTYHRMASPKERAKRSPVCKDLDWSEEGRRLRFPTRAEMRDVRDRLMRDTSFLRDCGLIDYSLLVGIHDIDVSALDEYRRPEAMRVISVMSGNDTISYFGIVDVLTPYGLWKRGETLLTGKLMCCRDVSCQPPAVYQRRFMKFCDDEVLACDENGNDCGRENEKGSDERSS